MLFKNEIAICLFWINKYINIYFENIDYVRNELETG